MIENLTIIALIFFGGGATGFLYVIVPHLYRLNRTSLLSDRCAKERVISLTYDDGPGKTLSEQLFSLLRTENVKATFFVLGKRAQTSEDTVRKCAQEGHDVGSHTFDHLHAWKALPNSCVRDIEAGRQTVNRLGGNGMFFRPTFGKLNIWTMIHVLREKYTLLWWTIDTSDSQESPKSVEEVLKEIDSKGGGVVLMHDYDEYKTGDHVDYVLTMTTAIIEHARRNNMKILPLSEIVGRP